MKSLSNYILESQTFKLDSDGKEHGFDYVDLGLPSGNMWATCNVGADKPEDFGLLFQFGRADGYKYGDKKNKFSTSDENENATGNEHINLTTSSTNYEKKDILNLEDDAAHINMGGKWKMPTKDDLQELYDNTERRLVTNNGKKGVLFTSKLNGKSIFVVFAGHWSYHRDESYFSVSGSAGYLRSSEVFSSDSEYAWCLHFNFNGACGIYCYPRAYAYSVRGVFKK